MIVSADSFGLAIDTRLKESKTHVPKINVCRHPAILQRAVKAAFWYQWFEGGRF